MKFSFSAFISIVLSLVMIASPAGADGETVITVEGEGFGHGVGMSQYGAYGRALPVSEGGGGQTSTEILNFYYPTADLASEIVPDDLKVHIFSGLGATITTSGPIAIKNSNGDVFVTLTAGTPLTVGIDGNGIIEILNIAGTNLCTLGTLGIPQHCDTEPITIELTEGEPIQTEVISQFTDIGTSGNSYQWGSLTLRYRQFEGGGIYVMLEDLPMDKYLYGLAEVPPTWPNAALEAQAIAGRTYAYKRVEDRRSNINWSVPWDIYSTINDQYYSGYTNESATHFLNWKTAVDQTTNTVLLTNNVPITTYYGSSNGGYSGAGSYVFCTVANYPCNDISYLPAQVDAFDHIGNPYANWTRQYTGEELGRWIANSSLGNIGDVTSITLSGNYGQSGRTDHVDLDIQGTQGSAITKGDTFMAIVNEGLMDEGRGYDEQILSTLYTFPNDPDPNDPDPNDPDPNDPDPNDPDPNDPDPNLPSITLTNDKIDQDYSNFLPPGWIGAEANDKFGSGFAYGDLNGDQMTDFVIAAPGESIGPTSQAGIIHTIYKYSTEVNTVLSTYQGEGGWPGSPDSDDEFGASLVAGDFNGDGFDDVVIGSPGEDVNGIEDAGTITVAYGSADGFPNIQVIHQDTNWIAGTAHADDRFGSALAVGDMDADGYDDLVIGVPGEYYYPNDRFCNKKGPDACGSVGAINVLYGAPGGLSGWDDHYFGQNTSRVAGIAHVGDQFGAAVAVGDINGDGYDDVVIGSPDEYYRPNYRYCVRYSCGQVGAINVLYGSSDGVTTANDHYFAQNSSGIIGRSEVGDRFGAALAIGDIDGDGYEDVVIGAPDDNFNYYCRSRISSICGNVGSVNILYGAENGLSSSRNQSFDQNSSGLNELAQDGDEFGAAVALGDLNDDSYLDLIIGVPGETISGNNNAGAAHILYGTADGITTSGSQLLHVNQDNFTGNAETNAGFGSALLIVDGEILIGAPGATVSGATGAGAIYYLQNE